MVYSRDREAAERPPVSVILPRLYLGAERDVTQEHLNSLGVSFVLSVSRCSPQPPFLPCSNFLRIPIDDSLWDDLLPWIPQALHFIDAARASGASVLVHCAAGISRSPALAVAYVMYRLDLDLDHAYRFVKERRPSISPNFNFLGQLQHFQNTLNQNPAHLQLNTPLRSASSSAHQDDNTISSAHQDDNTISSAHQDDNTISSAHQDDNTISSAHQDDSTISSAHQDDSTISSAHQDDISSIRVRGSGSSSTQAKESYPKRVMSYTNNEQHGHTHTDTHADTHTDSNGNVCLSLSGKLHSLRLNLNQSRDSQLHFPSCSASLAEKRRGLSLSLAPVAVERPQSECGRAEVQQQQGAPLSPFGSTLSKLLDWGERLLLGGGFVQSVRGRQSALHYR